MGRSTVHDDLEDGKDLKIRDLGTVVNNRKRAFLRFCAQRLEYSNIRKRRSGERGPLGLRKDLT